jgi:hypothetical protein
MQFAPIVVNILAYKVNTLDHMSNLVNGPFQGIDLFLSNKRNQGFGEDNGDLNQINLPLVSTIDNDLLDGTSQKTSFI